MPKRNAALKPNDFPLYEHPSGQWARRVKNPKTKKWTTFYFGKDKDKAIQRWHEEKDALFAGATPKSRAKTDKPTLEELGNVYIAWLQQRNATTGKPGLRHIELSEYTLRHLMRMVGADAMPEEWGPLDFAELKIKLFEPVPRDKPTRGKVWGRQVEKRSAVTVGNDVRRIRAFLKWCHKAEHIPAPRYGDMFPIETEMAHTKESVKRIRKDFDAKDLRAIVEKAKPSFKPLVLLGVNAGLGNRDIATMTLEDFQSVSEAKPWMDLPRLKTGAERRFKLWSETIVAIQAYLEMRPHPKRGYENVLFLTSHGHPWLRGEAHMDVVDSIGTGFTKLRKECGIARGSFYDLRRTFATVASETQDLDAVRHVMGHLPPKSNMLGRTYVQGISNERIDAVCEHVREWLFGKPSKAAKGGKR